MNGYARLRKALQSSHEEIAINLGIDGELGKRLSDGSWVIDIVTRPGWVYVGYNDGGRNTVIEALDSGVPRIAGMPVQLFKMKDGQFEVKASGAKTANWLGLAALYTGNVGYHAHPIGSGLDDYVNPNRFTPGLVRATTPPSLSVQIEAFNLPGGILVPATTLDLTPYLPATVNTWQWVKVAYDIDAADFIVIEGTEVPVLVPLNEQDLADISTAGYWPLGAVRLREDDTSIPDVDANKVARFAIESPRLFLHEDAPRRENNITRLATVAAVNLNTSTPSTLYTAPAGQTAIITHFIVRLASTSLSTVSFSIGWNSAAFNNVVADATHTELTGNTLYTVLPAKAGAAIGAAAGLLKLLCNVLQGGAATVTIDVFGYVY